MDPVRLTLRGRNADAWAWRKSVTGTCSGCEQCPDLHLRVNATLVNITPPQEDFQAIVPLSEGENRIVAECRTRDGEEIASPPLTYSVRLSRRPTGLIQISVTDQGIVLEGGRSNVAELGGSPVVRHLWSARPTNPSPLQVQASDGRESYPLAGELESERLLISSPHVDGEYYISLQVTDREGHVDVAQSYFVVSDGRARTPHFEVENPTWVDEAVVYGVIVRNFGSDGFRSVTERLPYLRELGVNALWLSPVNATPEGNFGYGVTDYFELRPDCGTKADFKEMIRAAHSQGIRVLMDFVPNHTSVEHRYFQDAQSHGRESGYYDFYDRDSDGQPTHYFHWEHLPNLNFDNPEVSRFMLEAFSYWVREFDVDGFRVDVAWGIRQRNPEFWPRWRQELQRIKPDLLLLAEASARDPYYFTEGFDAAYDWTDELGHWAWEKVWEDSSHLTQRLHAALTNEGKGFHEDALVFRFLNNNDTGARFISNHGEGLTRVATALLLTLPGVPCVYTGDEVGEWFSPYVDAGPITWEDKYGLLAYHKQLIQLRKQTPALRSRQWLPLDVRAEADLYGYLRYTGEAEQPHLVLLNFSEQDQQVQVRLPTAFQHLTEGGVLHDLLAGDEVDIQNGDTLTIHIAPSSARILATPRQI